MSTIILGLGNFKNIIRPATQVYSFCQLIGPLKLLFQMIIIWPGEILVNAGVINVRSNSEEECLMIIVSPSLSSWYSSEIYAVHLAPYSRQNMGQNWQFN